MKYSLLLFIALVVWGEVSAQQRRLLVGPYMSADVNRPFHRQVQESINETIFSKPSVGITAGIHGLYKLSRKTIVGFGFGYAYERYKPNFFTDRFGLIAPEDPELFISYPYLTEHRFESIKIPLSLRYYLHTSARLKPYLLTSVEYSFRLQEKQTYMGIGSISGDIFAPAKNGFTVSSNKFQYISTGFSVGLGVTTQLSSRWQLHLEPALQLVQYRTENQPLQPVEPWSKKNNLATLRSARVGFYLTYTF
jgi:hypothetical protein